MTIDIGDLKKIKIIASSIEFRKGRKTVKEVTVFIDFEEIDGLYFNLKRDQVISLVNNLNKALKV